MALKAGPRGDGKWPGYSTVYSKISKAAELMGRDKSTHLSDDHIQTMGDLGSGHEGRMKHRLHWLRTYGWLDSIEKRNPSPGSLAARVAFGAVAPGATLALTAADIVDAVDQGLLDEAAGVVLKPMEMGGELVGRMVNPEFTSKHKGYYFYRIEYGKYAHHQPPPLPMDDWIVEADKAEQSHKDLVP
jgi:hypothetical protein